jgi:hypothetical protein
MACVVIIGLVRVSVEAIDYELGVTSNVNPAVVVVRVAVDYAADLVADHVEGFLLVNRESFLP